jgi:cytochrome P450
MTSYLVLADPSLGPATLEESLRFDSPFQFSFREATRDVELSGVRIPKGGLIILPSSDSSPTFPTSSSTQAL